MAFPIIPALLGAANLGGLFFQNDPSKQYEKYFRNLQWMFSPENINNRAQGMYQNWLGSPAFADAKRGLLGGANAIQNRANRMNAGYGAQTGIGNASSALAAGAYGHGLSGLHAAGWNQSMQAALDALRQQAGQAGQFPTGPAMTAGQNYASVLGPLNNFFLQYLLNRPGVGQNWMMNGGLGFGRF